MKKPSKKLKEIPKFKSEAAERAFWHTHDSTEYVDWENALDEVSFPNLKPTTRAVSIRLPEWLIAELKSLANLRDIPYQSLMKVWLIERVKKDKRS